MVSGILGHRLEFGRHRQFQRCLLLRRLGVHLFAWTLHLPNDRLRCIPQRSQPGIARIDVPRLRLPVDHARPSHMEIVSFVRKERKLKQMPFGIWSGFTKGHVT